MMNRSTGARSVLVRLTQSTKRTRRRRSQIAGALKGLRARQAREPVPRLPSRGVVRCHRIPVDHVPESGDVVRTTVLIVQVVGMLPHVQTQDWRVAFHVGTVLIGCGVNGQRAVSFHHEPCPTGTEARSRSGREGSLELVKRAKRRVDRRTQEL